MKKLLPVLIMCLLFISCGNDDNDSSTGIKLSITKCTLDNNNPSAVVDVKKGAGGYIVKSSDEKVAYAIFDSPDNKIYIEAIGQGSATVTVTDKNNNTATIDVLVKSAISQPVPVSEVVFLVTGAIKILDYPADINVSAVVTDKPDIASADFFAARENQISILGMKVGEAKVALAENSRLRHIYDVRVMDAYDILIDGDNQPVKAGEECYFNILCGNGNYMIESSDESLATYELLPYSGDIIQGIMAHPATIKVKTFKPGIVEFTIIDSGAKSKAVKVAII